MSRIETNERKRQEMGELVYRLQGLGWTTAQLAAWMYVTPSTIRAWMRADSMGTNAQRTTLAKLKSPAEETPRILEIAAGLDVEADKSEAVLADDVAVSAHYIAGSRHARIARLRARADQLRALFPRL